LRFEPNFRVRGGPARSFGDAKGATALVELVGRTGSRGPYKLPKGAAKVPKGAAKLPFDDSWYRESDPGSETLAYVVKTPDVCIGELPRAGAMRAPSKIFAFVTGLSCSERLAYVVKMPDVCIGELERAGAMRVRSRTFAFLTGLFTTTLFGDNLACNGALVAGVTRTCFSSDSCLGESEEDKVRSDTFLHGWAASPFGFSCCALRDSYCFACHRVA